MFVALQVLVLAAQELSRPTTAKREPLVGGVTPTSSSDLSPYVSDKPANWRQEVEKRIQSKTRRLRKVFAADGYLYLPFSGVCVTLFNHFLCVLGCDTTSAKGRPEPVCSCGRTLLFPFVGEL